MVKENGPNSQSLVDEESNKNIRGGCFSLSYFSFAAFCCQKSDAYAYY